VEHIKAHFILIATLPLVIVLMDMKIIKLILKITKKKIYIKIIQCFHVEIHFLNIKLLCKGGQLVKSCASKPHSPVLLQLIREAADLFMHLPLTRMRQCLTLPV